MSGEYTPSTEGVSSAYRVWRRGTSGDAVLEFDRWLRQVKAEAWEEGFFSYGANPYLKVEALPLHRTEAGYPNCATCDGGGCLDCTDPA
jgi:hypothetical protein